MPETRRRAVVGHLGPRHSSLCLPGCTARRHLTLQVDNSILNRPLSGQKGQ